MELACKGVLGTRAGAHHGASSSSAAAVALSTTSVSENSKPKVVEIKFGKQLSLDEIKELNQDKKLLIKKQSLGSSSLFTDIKLTCLFFSMRYCIEGLIEKKDTPTSLDSFGIELLSYFDFGKNFKTEIFPCGHGSLESGNLSTVIYVSLNED